ncbi:MAG: hypothetical protein QOC60_245 [Frankiaceae bacterium]|nr:hypothetical protein [Frankiaceae bacterium]
MSSPDLRAQSPALSAAGETVAAAAGSVDEAGGGMERLPSAVDAALTGSATSAAFRAAVRAWVVVSRCVADELRTLGFRLRATADGLQSADDGLAARLTDDGPR